MQTALLGLLLTLVAADKPEWKPLFDGKTLDGWKQAGYGGESEASVENGVLVIPMGERLSGITYTGGEVPKVNYEIDLEARRTSGTDFFVGLTFPMNDAHASLILGGWGGSVCGISSFDGEDANDNETRKVMRFKKDQWYKVRLRVEPKRIQVWVDDQPLIDADPKGRKVDIRPEIELSKPLGLATFATTAEIKGVRLRELKTGREKN
jgi:hypothetical protein